MALQQIVHVDQFYLHLMSTVIAWTGGKFAHLDDGARQVPTQMQDILAKTLQIERAQAKPLNANFQEFAGRSFGQRSQVNSVFVSPIQAPRIPDLALRIAVLRQIDVSM